MIDKNRNPEKVNKLAVGSTATPADGELLVSGNVGIGAPIPDSLLEVEKDQNATTRIHVDNNTAGTAAVARMTVESNANQIDISAFSSSYTTSNQYAADSTLIESVSASQLGISAYSITPIVLYTNSTPRLTIDGTSGLATFSAGIAFQSATTGTGTSSEAFTLNKYETGEWTPVVVASSGSSPTYSAQVGHYTRVGNMCWVYASVTLTGLGSLSGKLGVSGLPWGGVSSVYPQGETLLDNLSTSIVEGSCYINSTDSKVYFPIKTAAATSFTRDANASDFSATSVIRITLSYRIP